MRVREQSDSVFPERDPAIHEYRAALFSVFLHTSPQGAPRFARPPDIQPLPLPGALETIHQLPGRLLEDALAIAQFRLTAAVLVERREEFIPSLAQLLGEDVRNPAAFMRDQEQNFREDSISNLERPLTYEDIRRLVYRRSTDETAEMRPGQEDAGRRRKRKAEARVEREPIEEARHFLVTRPESTVDLETLVTTVDIPSTSNCDFATLARTLDPRNWGPSPFWPECYQAELSPDGREFAPLLNTADAPVRGTSWNGYLYEHVEWNWNVQRIASFQNYLNIDYAVDEPNQRIEMRFSLFSCEGSRLYAVSFNRGIDVDSGFQTVELTPSASAEEDPFMLRTVKNIRYSDLLDRRSPNQGPPGTGQILSYMAPAVVGLWMNELVKKLYC